MEPETISKNEEKQMSKGNFFRKVCFALFALVLIFALVACGGKSDNYQTSISGQQVNVLILGTFHFNFPNLDVVKTAEENQIDVLLPEYQKEIELIVEKLSRFQPTHIVIEFSPDFQSLIDSLYNQYLLGNHQLGRDEHYQIGFRIAKTMGLQKLYCVDEMGNFTENIINFINNNESEEALAFFKSFEEDSMLNELYPDEPVFKTKGILAELIRLNDENRVKKSLGFYLTGRFKHEHSPYDFTGVDFETGRWFSRNLKIFRNIQRIETQTSDRILVIYGVEHLNILNYLFECSYEYNLVKTNDFF